MRIVHTCLRYPPATGGVETYVKNLAEHTRQVPTSDHPLSDNEIRDVRVLTSKLRTHGPISELNPKILRPDPPYIQRLHHLATPFITYPRLQALPYYLSHHHPDIIHAHSFWYQPADTAARYARRHNIPFIFNPYYYENSVRHKATWQLYRHTIGKKTFATADVVIVISPFEQKLIEHANFPVKRFELIPPGIDIKQFTKPHPNPFPKLIGRITNYELRITDNVLLTVSRLAPSKGLDELIAALPQIIKTHPTTHLAIIGEDFGVKAALIEQAKSLGIEGHVHFLGKVSNEDLTAAYQHADIFIHPSHYEAFGIVLAEALAAGTPVIARNTSAIPFVAPPNQAGLLFQTPDELIKHTTTLLQNTTLHQKLATQGRHHITTNFAQDTQIKKLIGIYEEVTNQP